MEGVTVAVNVIELPKVAGFRLEVTAVVVVSCTVWLNGAELEAMKLPVGTYDAFNVRAPTGKAVVESVATPPESVPVPRLVAPL
jgi:hypothetical protein